MEVRYPTDIYLVMIELWMNGNQDLPEIYHQQIDTVQAAVRGQMQRGVSKLTILNWI